MKYLIALVSIALTSTALVGCDFNTPAAFNYGDALKSKCDIIRDQASESRAMISNAGAEMDRQSARDGYPSTYQQDMLAQDKAMYDGMLSANGCV